MRVCHLSARNHPTAVPTSWKALYFRRVPKFCVSRLVPVPAFVCAAAVLTAPAAVAAPAPPARMSTVGGERLGQPGTQVNPGAGIPALPKNISARSWIVSDAETGEVLAAHNAHWKLPPASTLKMLFADTVLPKLDKNTVHKVTSAELSGLGQGSSLVGVKENLTYSVHDLWLGVFLRSGNDAVHVLSAMNGGVHRTVLQMRARARDLQANDTNVVTPDGYDMPNQTSSAYDLTLFARSGLRNADFRAYCSTVTADFPGDVKKARSGKSTKARATFQIQNTNRLLTGAAGQVYRGIAGVKNGYTTNAGNTYTGVAQRGGRTLLVTVMHPGPGYDVVYKEAAGLLDWGFEADGKATPVGTLVAPLSARRSTAHARTAASPAAGGTGDQPTASAGSHAGSGSGGLPTALGVTGAALALVCYIGWFVRRRWPLPAGAGGRGPGRDSGGDGGSGDGGGSGRGGPRKGRRRSG
jgi:serine-type D-Ala-D-Ala carboxypeptidase (penicillin-binding protein 5/6)